MPATIKAGNICVSARPLTREGFAPFGDVIENPVKGVLPSADETKRLLPPNGSIANQGSALKLSNVSPMDNHYDLASSAFPAKTAVSMFVCHPRRLRPVTLATSAFDINILERHPYTTQTFIPMGLSAADRSTYFLVVVAPTLPDAAGSSGPAALPKGAGAPDLNNIQAFVASGTQAVTYGAGTWHAPMVAVGVNPIDFVVYQFANGVANEDCQEVLIEPLAPASQGPYVVLHRPTTAPKL